MRSDSNRQEQVDGNDGKHPTQGEGTQSAQNGSDGIIGVPAGWEVIRIGTPKIGEFYLLYSTSDDIYPIREERDIPDGCSDVPMAIVQRKAHWQKLWPIQWKWEPVEGRFRSHVDDPWEYGTIIQYRPGPMKWKASDGRWFTTAEVRSMNVPK